MYLSRQPAATAQPELLPLPLARIITRSFATARPYGEELVKFFGDLATEYGLPFSSEEFARGGRTTFTDMVAGIQGELSGDGAPVGLVVLAHTTPDSEPTWPACYLTSVLPGAPLSFAVTDHGVVAPFTALRIAGSYMRTDHLRRAIVLILDQTTLLARDPAPRPIENRIVALSFDEEGGIGSLSARTVPDVDVPPLEVEDRTAVVLGAGLGGAGGLPCTGVWLELADNLDRWRADGVRRVLIADYDAGLRALGRCLLHLA